MPLQAPMAVSPFQTPAPQPSPFQPQLVSTMAPVNLTSALNAAGPSRLLQGTNPHVTPDGHYVSVERSDDEWDIPRTHKKKKGKTIRPATSQNSAFERLGIGKKEPARTRVSRQEEEAESQPRGPVANRLTVPNDHVQQMEAKLERLEKKVGEKNDWDKPLAGSPFTTRVHLTPFPRKVKIDAPSTAGQRESENLTQFLTRWKEEVDKVEEMDDKTVLSLLLNGLRAGELYKEFCRKPPTTYQEAYHTAWEFAEAETQLRAKKETEHGFKPKPVQVKKEEVPGPSRPRHHYDPVVRVVNTKEFQEIRKAPVIPPENLTGQTGRQWSGTYCSYHRSDSHNTSECKSVYGVIRKMIDSGELGKDYLQKAQENSHQWVRQAAQGNDQDNDRRRNNRQREQELAPDKEHIGMIFGGPEGGDSATQRKNWVRSIYVGEVSAEPARRKQARREPIIFTDRDLPPTDEDHNDPLVITMDINGVDVARVLVDTGSSVNILYLKTFQKLRLCRTQLEPLKTPLSGFTGDTVEAEGSRVLPVELESGFTGDTVEAEGSIVLPVELGSGDKTVWKKMRFIVVDIKCVHNAILGRPDINKVWAVISMPHLCMKFHTPGGVGEVRGDQRNARECYARAVKKMTKGVNVISQEITKGETREKLEPEAETVEIELHPAIKGQTLADFLVEMTGITPDAPVDKPTEQWWEMAVDGASGLKGYGGGVVFTTPEGFKIYHALVFNFKLTNNGAEYEALAGGLRLAQALKINRVSIKSDSSLIVGQVTGTMEAREGRMAQYKVLALLKGFEEFKIAQNPRAENADADHLSKLTQYAPEHVSKLARMEILDQASIEKLEVAAITAGSQSDRSNLVGADDH
ncbi:unnamed protein product [Cuscuta campestris]|uniref:RNase H type-1 domain-containing protein n=1 Tax=Cuscuta campestris TaxID=132261 RepID=A0A484KGD8_9ASTE|nr:unnamed protein product [Cuscuta campestris]